MLEKRIMIKNVISWSLRNCVFFHLLCHSSGDWSERNQTSKIKTTVLQFVLEAPSWCTILCFLFSKLWWDNNNYFCLSIRSKCWECYWMLCTFKSTKHTTKEADGLHNHSTLSTVIMSRPFFLLYNAHSCLFFSYQLVVTDELVLREPSCKVFQTSYIIFVSFPLPSFFCNQT